MVSDVMLVAERDRGVRLGGSIQLFNESRSEIRFVDVVLEDTTEKRSCLLARN